MKVVILNTKSNEKQESLAKNDNGEFLAVLQPCSTYSIDYLNGTEKLKSESLSVPCDGEKHDYTREIQLIKKEEIVFNPEKPIQTKIDADKTYAEYSH